tara:strand:+ start:886 stop:1119 length:234 start_codon:yes stop_codon:yes gene_type:complete
LCGPLYHCSFPPFTSPTTLKRKGENMQCWHCKSELIWGGDHDYEDYGKEGEGIVSNFHCPDCESYYECYLPLGNQND